MSEAALKLKTPTKFKLPIKPRKKTVAERSAELAHLRKGIAITLGVAIPAMSLTLSHIAGTLASECVPLAAFLGLTGCSVLVVSLSHLAEAIADATGAEKWQAWALAITLDLGIVGCELSHVYADNAALWYWTTGLMVCTMLLSMVFNVYAFLKHTR
jgi:hypothetical protein